MAASFTVVSGNTTVTMTWVKPTAVMLNTITAAAHILWIAGAGDHTGTFESLSNQQKLDIIYAWVREQIVEMSRDYTINTAVTEATATAVYAATVDANANIDF